MSEKSNLSLFIASMLKLKNAGIRETKVDMGEFVFDYNGDLIGIYMGDGHISMCSKSLGEEIEKYIVGMKNER